MPPVSMSERTSASNSGSRGMALLAGELRLASSSHQPTSSSSSSGTLRLRKSSTISSTPAYGRPVSGLLPRAPRSVANSASSWSSSLALCSAILEDWIA